jgi:diguanylate cyclase (GGDEF)-like protein
MSAPRESIEGNRRLMAYTAAAMYGAAALDGAIEGFLPGDPRFALAPVLGAAAVALGLLVLGPRLARGVLALLGPIGVFLIAVALSAAPGPGDGAILYVWPVLWTSFFFGRRGAVAILACVGVGHAATLMLLPAASSFPGRWLDVMISVSVASAVVLTLSHRNRALVAALASEARTDPLTGLLNRRGLHERAAIELARAARERRSLATVAFDIDNFKGINDEWGHDVGDRVIAHIGRMLAEHARDVDIVARIGGEEFVVVLPDTGEDGATAFSERIRAAFARMPRDLPRVRTSAGVHTEIAPTAIEPLLSRADFALYEAKRAGRNRTRVFERELGCERDASFSAARIATRPARTA